MKYEPLPIEELRERVELALCRIWTLGEMLQVQDAGELKPHTFDFEDGTRLIATMIEHDPAKPPALMVSMSVSPRLSTEELAKWASKYTTNGQPCRFKCSEGIRRYTLALLVHTDHKIGDAVDRGFTPENGAPFAVFEFTRGK